MKAADQKDSKSEFGLIRTTQILESSRVTSKYRTIFIALQTLLQKYKINQKHNLHKKHYFRNKIVRKATYTLSEKLNTKEYKNHL